MRILEIGGPSVPVLDPFTFPWPQFAEPGSRSRDHPPEVKPKSGVAEREAAAHASRFFLNQHTATTAFWTARGSCTWGKAVVGGCWSLWQRLSFGCPSPSRVPFAPLGFRKGSPYRGWGFSLLLQHVEDTLIK